MAVEFEYKEIQWSKDVISSEGPLWWSNQVVAADQMMLADGFKLIGLQDYDATRVRHYCKPKAAEVTSFVAPVMIQRATKSNDPATPPLSTGT